MLSASSIRASLTGSAGLAALALACTAPAHAQDGATLPSNTPTGAEVESESEDILVTGSRIRRDPNDSPLPLQIVTRQELDRNGISNPEQLISFLTTNGTGADNLASNADVTSGAQRGTNGLSAANLRGQGSASTLVLLNNRRVAAHGLSGAAVDVNQIPFAAIERVEVLKDGASALYGTDAVGGVINFITRTDYQGVNVTGFSDVTEGGDGNIYRLSGLVGYGDLDRQGFNIMGSVSYAWNEILRGEDRRFVNGNQPNRGLSIDTRGTPIATAFPLNPTTRFTGGTLLGGTSGANITPGVLNGGINILDLPGGAGCESMDGGMAYDDQLWNNPQARFACAWDTGRAAVIQQPIETLTYFGRAVARIAGDHELSFEITGSDATSAKSFSNPQLSSNTSNFQVAYPRNALTAQTYDAVYNAIAAQFPQIAANFGDPIAFRWRCIACGTREYVTDTKTIRGTLEIKGPLFGKWDYAAGASYAKSESASVLGSGFFYRGTLGNGAYDPAAPSAPGAPGGGLAGLLNGGILNPFSLAQTPEALAGLDAVSARGVTLYGGQYEVRQLDYSVSGPLFRLPGGMVQLAAGVDYRRETYSFNGSTAANADQPVIFLAAFDNVNALTPQNRDVLAGFAEVLIPLLPGLEVTGAVRVDDYSGFGTTTNPKVAVKFRPWEPLMFRASYNTGFRVPTFNQIFNGVTESPYSGRDLADPVRCPGGVPNTTDPNCVLIQPDILTGGNRNLGPETAEQASVGVVFQPNDRFSASVDWWMINVDDTLQVLTERELIDNAALFETRFPRDPVTREIIAIDRRWLNAGARRTQGLEVALRGGFDLGRGAISLGLDGTYLLKRKEKLTRDAEFGPSLIGVFTFAGDLSLRWKHNAFIAYSTENLSVTLTQIFRNGYRNQALPGIAAGTVTRPDFNPRVDDYVIYNLAATLAATDRLRLTAGIKNLFNTDPPFAITYDANTGAGSSWEPRVADPRGRSFTFQAEVNF